MSSMDASARHAEGESLKSFLAAWSAEGPGRDTIAAVVAALADAGMVIAGIVARSPLMGVLNGPAVPIAAGGQPRRKPEALADEALIAALRRTSTAYYASDEEDAILTLKADGDLAVAADPLDSTDICADITLGTLFSVFPASPEGATESFFRPGSEQVAAGYIAYGPHTALVFTLGEGVAHFVLDPEKKEFRLIDDSLKISVATREYAINASDYRHWLAPVRTFVDDCIEGTRGPHGKDFNMRWLGSLVAETHRILMRGGVFLYPGDQRPGYEQGRLSLIFQANAIAMVSEQAGGGATDGYRRILDKKASEMSQRSPLVFGSAEKVERIAAYFTDAAFERVRSPLFGERGLFHA